VGKISCQESEGKHLNIRGMRKAAIQSQKSHMPPACERRRGRLAANRRRAMIRAARVASQREHVFAAPCQASVTACMVSTSAVPVPGVRHVSSRVTAVAAAGRVRGGLGTRTAGANGTSGGSRRRGSGPGKGNAVPSIRKGTRRIIRGRRVSVSGETTSPWLSRHESLPDARDLQMTTLSNESTTESNIFGFVMT
jgi:hypothetical protein